MSAAESTPTAAPRRETLPADAPPTLEAQAALADALARAQAAAQAVPLDARNDHHKYPYASAESIIDEARSALSSHDLAASQLSSTLRSVGPHVVVRTEYLLQHKAGGRVRWSRDWFVIEGKGRPYDRAAASALTSSLAYALRDLLLLPRDNQAAGEAAMDRRDDRDHDPEAEAAARRERERPAQQPRDEERPRAREEQRERTPPRADAERRPPPRDREEEDRPRQQPRRDDRRRDDR